MKKRKIKVKINWWDHLVNLLVVIIGVTVAFQLSEFDENRRDEKLKKEYFKSFISDIETDIGLIDTLIKVNSQAIYHNKKLIGAIRSGDTDNDSLSSWIHSLRYIIPFKAQSTTYESMKASGNIELIDFKLRNSIIELYEQYYDGGYQYDKYHTKVVEDYTLPFIINEIVFIGEKKIDGKFLSNNKFQNIIYSQLVIAELKNEFYKQMREQAVKLKEQLTNTLEEE